MDRLVPASITVLADALKDDTTRLDMFSLSASVMGSPLFRHSRWPRRPACAEPSRAFPPDLCALVTAEQERTPPYILPPL